MSLARIWEVGRRDLAFNLQRPMLWVLILLLAFLTWGLSTGSVRIQSGDSTVGGTDAHITSQFSQAFMLSLSILTFYGFFLAVAAGMTILRDEEHKVGELLHATLLTPGEYVWGKFLAVMGAFGVVTGLHLLMAMVFNHVLADAATAEYIGPFSVVNYVVPAFVFGLPTMMFLGGTAFAVGEATRRPILVFLLPVIVMLSTLTFLISWSPSWLSPSINRLLMLLDPSGYRWLNETWLKVDRGVAFYNANPIAFDGGFLLSRLAFVLVGLGAVVLSQRHFSRTLTGVSRESRVVRLIATIRERLPRWLGGTTREVHGAAKPVATAASLRSLQMTQAPVSFLSATITIARAEIRELLTRPGLYLFVPLIMIQATGNIVTTVAAFDAPALLTAGTMAVQMLNTLNLLVCFLLLFYMVESLQREFSAGLAPIYYSTPVSTGAVLFGKALGTSLVGVVILGAMLVVCLGILVVARLTGSPVPVTVAPFFLAWGFVLIPTFVVWSAFVMAIYAFTRSRYTSYALGIGVIVMTLRSVLVGDGLTWVTNWMGWGAVQWSDMGLFPLNARPLLWNRLFVLGLAAVFVALAVKFFGRQEFDAQRIIHRLRPKALAWGTLSLLPVLLIPTVIGVPLWRGVETGYQSEAEEKVQKDYWRRNLATWRDAENPAPTHVELDMEIEPARRWFRIDGSYRLVNAHAERLDEWAVTPGRWDEIGWTLDGVEYEPEDRAGLMVFEHPLEPGQEVGLGFNYEAIFPRGYTKGGGGAGQFVLDAGIVLTSFGPSWVPTVGYLENVGIDEDNSYEPREYPDDFYEGITRSWFGNEGAPYTTRIRVTAPEEFTLNSVGVKTFDETSDGRRTVVWQSDAPVTFFNLVGARWAEWEGAGTAIYYHPDHTYNLEEIGRALDASRRYYSEWFYPYPWETLKLSEFPALASYAQGFPTNITFSESIGFLTKNDPRVRTAFLVTAHEAAHQWWGNILTPGQGPGANILSEGMSHFSTLLLIEQVHGLGERIELAKRLESRYEDARSVDSERPLVKIDGSRSGDTTVTYDKGGWVAWMLMDLIGRDNVLAGLQEFIATFNPSPDHPVLQDLVATLRPHAPDPGAYDAFVQQWFFDVVVPEYQLSDTMVERVGADWRVTASLHNVGTGEMPVQVAAIRGERFPELRDEEAQPGRGAEPGEGYSEARTTVTVAADGTATVEILCDFQPEQLVVDPDAMVLQLRRERAVADLEG